MEYLQQLYEKVFGTAEPVARVVAFGNVILDRTATVTSNELLERHQLEWSSIKEIDADSLTAATADAFASYSCEENPGGAALNTTRILKIMGTETVFFGAVGEDENASKIRELLQQRGIHARLEAIPNSNTGQALCLSMKHKNAIFANVGASVNFSLDFLKSEHERQPFLLPSHRKQIVYVEGFFVPQREAVCDFILHNFICERRRLAVNLSATYIVEQNFEKMKQLIDQSYFVFGNASEYGALMQQMGLKSTEELGEQLIKDKAKILIITNGEHDVQVISNVTSERDEPNEIRYQSFKAKSVKGVLDTTGCGDGFVGAFLHCWLQKCSLHECMHRATEVSGYITTQIGCNLPPEVLPKIVH